LNPTRNVEITQVSNLFICVHTLLNRENRNQSKKIQVFKNTNKNNRTAWSLPDDEMARECPAPTHIVMMESVTLGKSGTALGVALCNSVKTPTSPQPLVPHEKSPEPTL
jgi:hypothetical protein